MLRISIILLLAGLVAGGYFAARFGLVASPQPLPTVTITFKPTSDPETERTDETEMAPEEDLLVDLATLQTLRDLLDTWDSRQNSRRTEKPSRQP